MPVRIFLYLSMVSSRLDSTREENATQGIRISYKDLKEAACYIAHLFTAAVEINRFFSSMLTIKNMDSIKMVN